MKKVIRLTESDLARIIKRVIKESDTKVPPNPELVKQLKNYGFKETSDINFFKKPVTTLKNAYVSIYNKSIGAVCFDETVVAGAYTQGFKDMKEAVDQSYKFAGEKKCKNKY
jgi:hypothetical protein